MLHLIKKNSFDIDESICTYQYNDLQCKLQINFSIYHVSSASSKFWPGFIHSNTISPSPYIILLLSTEEGNLEIKSLGIWGPTVCVTVSKAYVFDLYFHHM